MSRSPLPPVIQRREFEINPTALAIRLGWIYGDAFGVSKQPIFGMPHIRHGYLAAWEHYA